MGRSANCIRMLLLLKSRGFLTREELAQLLHTNIRNISEYRKELEEAGYTIESTTGKYGGYRLLPSSLFPVISLRKEELQAVKEAQSYLKSRGDFLIYSEFESACDKLLATTTMDSKEKGFYVETKGNHVSKHIKDMIKRMEIARDDHRVISILYKSMHADDFSFVRVHPYELLNDKGSYYCLGYSLKAKDFRKFKFSEERMQDLKILETSFQRDPSFHIKDHIGEMGLMKNEYYKLDLYIYKESALLVSEKNVGYDVVMEWIDENTLHYQAVMEGKIPTIQFLLSLGNQVHILAPVEIKKEILRILQDMTGMYQK